ncbi:hypothetical protein IAT38_007240 [Cryptococcus sp. DSM 104549]
MRYPTSTGNNPLFDFRPPPLPILPLPPLPPIKDEELYRMVITHTSLNQLTRRGAMSLRRPTEGEERSWDYERLEHVGDGLLESIASGIIQDLYPWLRQGAAAIIRDHLVSNQSLAQISLMYALPSMIVCDPSSTRDVRTSEKTQASVLEAYIAGVFYDWLKNGPNPGKEEAPKAGAGERGRERGEESGDSDEQEVGQEHGDWRKHNYEGFESGGFMAEMLGEMEMEAAEREEADAFAFAAADRPQDTSSEATLVYLGQGLGDTAPRGGQSTRSKQSKGAEEDDAFGSPPKGLQVALQPARAVGGGKLRGSGKGTALGHSPLADLEAMVCKMMTEPMPAPKPKPEPEPKPATPEQEVAPPLVASPPPSTSKPGIAPATTVPPLPVPWAAPPLPARTGPTKGQAYDHLLSWLTPLLTPYAHFVYTHLAAEQARLDVELPPEVLKLETPQHWAEEDRKAVGMVQALHQHPWVKGSKPEFERFKEAGGRWKVVCTVVDREGKEWTGEAIRTNQQGAKNVAAWMVYKKLSQ